VRTYLDPTAPIAPDAILVDDPKGAMDLAVAVCESPRMSNLAHGLWGYHGTTSEGQELTIQALGIGGPSAFCVVSDLGRLGVRRAIRIGSCISLDRVFELGSVIVAAPIEASEGLGAALSASPAGEPDEELTRGLLRASGARATVPVRSVYVYPERPKAQGGEAAIDLSTAAVVAAGAAAAIACASALIVAESPGRGPLDKDALDEALRGLGKRAGAALGAAPQASGL